MDLNDAKVGIKSYGSEFSFTTVAVNSIIAELERYSSKAKMHGDVLEVTSAAYKAADKNIISFAIAYKP